jgi:hypothetical protein
MSPQTLWDLQGVRKMSIKFPNFLTWICHFSRNLLEITFNLPSFLLGFIQWSLRFENAKRRTTPSPHANSSWWGTHVMIIINHLVSDIWKYKDRYGFWTIFIQTVPIFQWSALSEKHWHWHMRLCSRFCHSCGCSGCHGPTGFTILPLFPGNALPFLLLAREIAAPVKLVL